MSSQNFLRASQNLRAEHVSVDYLTHERFFFMMQTAGIIPVFFHPNRFVPDKSERFDRTDLS
jgi:hypothetical protein